MYMSKDLSLNNTYTYLHTFVATYGHSVALPGKT